MEKNGDLVKWLVRALYGIIILWLINLTTNLICIDKDSRNRDDLEASQRMYLGNEVTRVDTNQKEVMKNVDKLLGNQERLLNLIPAVARIEKKIDEIR